MLTLADNFQIGAALTPSGGLEGNQGAVGEVLDRLEVRSEARRVVDESLDEPAVAAHLLRGVEQGHAVRVGTVGR